MGKRLVLILGRARSGKSSFAEHLVRSRERVLFVATSQALDEDMERRIAAHRVRRPPEWRTLEEPIELASVIHAVVDEYDTCLVDCFAVWVSNLLLSMEGNPNAEAEILTALDRVLEVYDRSSASWIAVSNEVELGVVPPSQLGREYRDILGKVNQAVAARADEVYLMVAGIALELKSLGALPFTSVERWDG